MWFVISILNLKESVSDLNVYALICVSMPFLRHVHVACSQYLLKRANQLLRASGKVVNRPHHTSGSTEQEQARVLTILQHRNQTNLESGRNLERSEMQTKRRGAIAG